MENIFKNRLKNYEEAPPEFLLNNIKKKISGNNSSLFIKSKLYIAAAVVVAIVASIIVLNYNSTKNINKVVDNKVIANKTNKIINKLIVAEKQEQTITVNTPKTIIEKNTTIITEELIEKEQINNVNETAQIKVINKTINAGTDVVVCGTTYKLSAENTKNGNWIANKNVEIQDVTNPNSDIICKDSNKEVQLVWQENLNENYIFDTVQITFISNPKSDIVIDKTNETCANSNAVVTFITNSDYNYIWEDGYSTKLKTRENLAAGTYNINIKNKGCEGRLEVIITNSGTMVTDFYHTELYSSVGIPFYFTNRTKYISKFNYKVDYTWDFGDGSLSEEKAPEHTFAKAGEYNVKLVANSADGCTDSKTMTLKIAEHKIKMPTIFTPNGDGMHDVLILKPKTLTKYQAVVFDRAGREIAVWNNPTTGWNGKLRNGEDAQEGTYFYSVSGLDEDGKKFNYRSSVMLKRKY